jgi:hypothetical protein
MQRLRRLKGVAAPKEENRRRWRALDAISGISFVDNAQFGASSLPTSIEVQPRALPLN